MRGYGNYDYNMANEVPAWVHFDRYDFCEMPEERSSLFGLVLQRIFGLVF